MDIVTYVANEDDRRSTEEVFGQAAGRIEAAGLAASELRCENLYGSEFDGIPGIVLRVMRIMRGENVMPLTVANGHPVVAGTVPTVEELLGFVRDGVDRPAAFIRAADSAVDFPTDKRLHVSMLVRDLDTTVRFYEVFFGQPPSKRLDDYAKFELEEPPLVISFIPDAERPRIPGGANSFLGVNHLGVQVKSTDVVMAMKERFVQAGFLADEELESPCCYAVQTKIWVGDPDGTRWEIYVNTQDDAEEGCGPDCVCYAEIAPSVPSDLPTLVDADTGTG
jgi:catechol 2,3-dioxygenase-like lactoylglutathione lyase family enzyme